MATIVMPQLGESVTEGTITRWLKQEGDRIVRDEPLLEVMTDKVNAEIPSPYEGVLAKILVPEGTKVNVGEPLANIEEAQTREAGQELALGASAGSERKAALSMGGMGGRPEEKMQETAMDDTSGGHYSPLVRRLAREHGVDLSLIRGTGIGGRVTKEDVLSYVTELRVAETAKKEVPSLATPLSPAESKTGPAIAPREALPRQDYQAAAPTAHDAPAEEIIVPSPMRLAIAEHMVQSKRTAPHAWTVVEVDMTRLVRWRSQIKTDFEKREGVALTYLPYALKAVVASLKENPLLNASWVDGKIVVKKDINIGIAVALDDGLIVPVLRKADQMSVTGLAKGIADLVARARSGKLTPGDVQGGTFTVNNPGAFGSVVSMPIINQGQAAILAMEAIVKRPVVIEDDAVAVRSMMNLGLSFDHRVIDGATAGRFLQSIKRQLEAFGPDTPLY